MPEQALHADPIHNQAGAASAAILQVSVYLRPGPYPRSHGEKGARAVCAVPIHQPEPCVVVLDGEVRIIDFVETDPHVQQVLAEASNPEEATHSILRIGAQATLIAGTDVETEAVEHRFEDMTRTFDSSLGAAVERITKVSSDLLSEDEGALPRILSETKTGLKEMLDDTFDPDSKSSAIAKIDAIFEGALQQADRRVRAALNPDDPDSALAKTKREILETVKEQVRDLKTQLQEMALVAAANKARAEATDLTAVKGFSYEDLFERGLAPIAAIHGDIAERVSRKTGLSGTQNGDFLVTVNTEDTCGEEARFVLECKDGRLSMPKTMDELAKAIDNHDAQAAVAVFSRQEFAPGPLPFSWSGNRAVLVYDKDDPDKLALQLAYAWARWICRRELTTDGAALDTRRIEAALTRASQALGKKQSALSCLTAAKNKIDEGTGHVTALVDEVRSALEELRDALNGG